ncbi:MAG TPA: hypothetical protein VJJ24_01105 [Candidatus Paceibacterota bacterium]
MKKSYSEIAKELGIAKSTISYWLSKDPETREFNIKMLAENIPKNLARLAAGRAANIKKWDKWREVAKAEARAEFDLFFHDPLFTAGLMLYWGEGDSNPKNALRLSNINPQLVACYMAFLRKFVKVPEDKIKIGLILYKDINDERAKAYWQKVTGVSPRNFYKSQYIKGSHPTRRLLSGVCMVVVSTTRYKVKVQEWIEIFARKYYNVEHNQAGIV